LGIVSTQAASDAFVDDTLTDTGDDRPGEAPDFTEPHLFVMLECSCPMAGSTRHSLANIERVLDGRGPARSSERVFQCGVSTRATKIDMRVVSATHRPLEELVARGEFRSDLFARLAGFTFSIPPVRERREDIGLLIAAFATSRPFRFAPAVGRALLRYDWPLNVRELHHVLDLAATLADGEAIDLTHLPPAVRDACRPRKS
jgi:hypothetical protein